MSEGVFTVAGGSCSRRQLPPISRLLMIAGAEDFHNVPLQCQKVPRADPKETLRWANGFERDHELPVSSTSPPAKSSPESTTGHSLPSQGTRDLDSEGALTIRLPSPPPGAMKARRQTGCGGDITSGALDSFQTYDEPYSPLPGSNPFPTDLGARPLYHHHHFSPFLELPQQDCGKRHICQICGKNFLRPSSLRIHGNTHTGSKPFLCPQTGCGRAFNVRSNLVRHVRVLHAAGYGLRIRETDT